MNKHSEDSLIKAKELLKSTVILSIYCQLRQGLRYVHLQESAGFEQG